MFKVLVNVFRVVNGTAPSYLRDMFKRVQGNYCLRSSSDIQFLVTRYRTEIADRSLTVVGPKWWNMLPRDIKAVAIETDFKQKLKTHLFRQFYND